MYTLLWSFALVNLAWCENGTIDYSGWHHREGIPRAHKIKEAEDRYQRSLQFIVGGSIAPLYTHPYLAGLLIDVVGHKNPSACGGSLITNTRVLTAAHCWSDGRFQAIKMTVVLGSAFLFHGGIRIKTSTISNHPQYNPRTLANDIAMLYLHVRVPLSQAVQTIALPGASFVNFDFTGMWAQASGYGRYSDLTNPTTSTTVRNVLLRIISVQQCRSVFGNIVLDSNICTSGTGGVGICQGDSGGPLTVRFGDQEVLIDVSSFVAYDGCELGFPSAFARTTSYLEWIKSTL
ncbi:jg7958 [Pararge aegeria aegeria]|uniref:Jg7958 protein n=1 Tax=Pararge aegeria aegeria TaxID=348720 RepID=A0A8S4SH87_9NEOP|nr:jg7958 [Pararge aegeria aegeria]